MACSEFLLIGSDNHYRVDGLMDGAGQPINDATVNVTLKDLYGNAVSGQAWPLALQYETGSDGDYSGIFQAALQLVEDAVYQADVSIAGGGLVAAKKDWFRAVENR